MTIPPKSAQSDVQRTYAGEDELWLIERHLINYNSDLIAKLTRPRADSTNVLEFGAGIGTLAVLWESTTGAKPECVEIDPRQREIIQRRGFRCYENLESIQKKFDVIYTSNVLEHVEDDVRTLDQLNEKLNAGGLLIIYVPAFQILYSEIDERLGHYRRYGKKDLLNKLSDAGFVIDGFYFADSIGFFAWLYLKIRGGDLSKSQERSMLLYDKFIFPISKSLDVVLNKIFGKNILVYASKR